MKKNKNIPLNLKLIKIIILQIIIIAIISSLTNPIKSRKQISSIECKILISIKTKSKNFIFNFFYRIEYKKNIKEKEELSNYTFTPITNTKSNNKILKHLNNFSKSPAYKNMNEFIYAKEESRYKKDDVQIINNYVNNNYNFNILNEAKDLPKQGLLMDKTFSPQKEKNKNNKSKQIYKSFK